MTIDTLKFAKRLREAEFSDPQAEPVVATVQDAAEDAEVATKADVTGLRAEAKADIAELRAEVKADIAELRAEVRADIAALRGELREAELRLEAKIEGIKADILNRIFGLILGTLVVNIVAIIGAMFAVAKLVGH